MNYLNDDWFVTGTDIEEFKKELKNITTKTVYFKTQMDKILFFNITDYGDYYIIPLHHNRLWKNTKAAMSLKKYPITKDIFLDQGYDEETVHEAFENGLFINVEGRKFNSSNIKRLAEHGNCYPVSQKAMNSILARLNKKGGSFLTEDILRDLTIAKKFNKPVDVLLTVRTEKDKSKVFAIMSDKYLPIAQTKINEILDIIQKEFKDDFGDYTCLKWSIDHSLTRLYIEFPKAGKDFAETYEYPDKIIPGIMIETSDIGDCALRIRSYCRFEETDNVFYADDEVFQLHTTKLDMKDIEDQIKKTIYAKMNYYPQHLAELMTIDITTNEMSPKEIKQVMTKMYRRVSKEIGLVKAISKAKEKVIMDQLIDSINPELSYTAYDVATTFLCLANYIDTKDKTLIDTIAKTVPEVMKINFREEEEEDIVIV